MRSVHALPQKTTLWTTNGTTGLLLQSKCKLLVCGNANDGAGDIAHEIYLLTYLITYLIIYLLTYLFTYLLT